VLARVREAGGAGLIDARALPRFRGEVEPIDPVAGHIPGATCFPHSENLTAEGRFKDPAALRARWAPVFAGPEAPIAYCGSGVTAAHNLLAMAAAGLCADALPALYVGSFSEWIRDPARPVARGDA
jgi:thiosulfate/3-mercaptopyruvate sulfurtransferase